MASRDLIYRNQNPCDLPKLCPCPEAVRRKLMPLNLPDVKCRKRDLSSTVNKLAQIVVDPVSSANTPRVCRYLEDFITMTDGLGFYVKDLNGIMCILEFLALRVQEVPEYKKYLDHMLELSRTPPLLTKTSEGLFCSEILEHYFTLLAYLLLILPTEREILVVHESIHRLLDRSKPAHIAAVKLELCRRAVEESSLPVTVAELIEIATDEMFHRMLETTLLLISVSSKSCHKMMEVGLLEHILTRLDPNRATRLANKPPPEIPEDELGVDHNQFEILVAVTDIMWKISDFVMNETNSLIDWSLLKPPSKSAMWSLRYAFKSEVRCSGRNQSSVTMRNDLAAIMLAVLTTFPQWKFVECGLADDLIILAVATELGTENTWASNIMKRRRLLLSILNLVNPEAKATTKFSKDEAQFWDLHKYALYALTVLSTLMPDEFINHKGTTRLLMILEWSMSKEFDSRLILNCIKTVNSIIINGNEIIRKDFRGQGAIGTVIKLVQCVLSINVLNSQHQRILTHAMMILEALVRNDNRYQIMYGEQSIKIVLRMLQKCLYDQTGYFQLNNRLGIALGIYIWECIVWCSENLKMFVERGAVFLILDVIDAEIFPVKIIFLGLLCDICEEGRCETQLCTWRGKDKERGLVSLLARTWREEEIRIKARRTKDGCVDDLELPLMGVDQWSATFCSKNEVTTSPALSEMMGSCLPKIYGIRKILYRNSERYELAKNHYKILLEEIPTEDKVTMLIIDHYFRLKQGEIWVELQRDILRIGIVPLRIDGEVIFLMLQNYRRRALYIKSSQEAILEAAREAEIREEKAVYKKLIDSKLAPALDALYEIDFISRTTDPRFMRQRKQRQRADVDRSLNFPKNVESQYCHRTFLGKTNVTAIMNHDHIIRSDALIDGESDKYKLMPVSPSTSNFTSDLTVGHKADPEIPCRGCFVSGLPCLHD